MRAELERRRGRDLIQRLSTIEGLDQEVLPAVLPLLSDYLGVDNITAYSVALGANGIECDGFHSVGVLAKPIETFFRSTLRAEGARYYTYDPLHPPKFQRNRVLRLADWPRALRKVVIENHNATWGRFGLHDQMRVLICDRTVPLWWIGSTTDMTLDEHRAQLFRRLVPALHRRLVLDMRLRDSDAARDAIDLTLESIGAPAFILDARGRLRHANGAGRALLGRDRRAHLAELADALHGSTPVYERFNSTSTGVAAHVLLVRRIGRTDDAARLVRARTTWNLTPRQTEVLALVVQGLSNRTISARLRCALHTVELHVSELLRRADAPSRAALIVKLGKLG